MKVFISWSGERGKAIGAILKDWLYETFHNAEFIYTPRTLKAGSQGTSKLYELLRAMDMGIMVYTSEGTESHWMTFEAGAIHGRTSGGVVIPLIFGVDFQELPPPLKAFQWKTFTKSDFMDVFRAVNERLGDLQLDEQRLLTLFNNRWEEMSGRLEQAVGAVEKVVLEEKKKVAKKKTAPKIIEEEEDPERQQTQWVAVVIFALVIYFFIVKSGSW